MTVEQLDDVTTRWTFDDLAPTSTWLAYPPTSANLTAFQVAADPDRGLPGGVYQLV